jgi:hypothetical protein
LSQPAYLEDFINSVSNLPQELRDKYETRTPVAERRLGTFSGLVWLEVWRTADFTPCHSQLI